MGIGNMFKKFLLARQVQMENGRFSIAGVRQSNTPVSTLISIQEEVINRMGNDGIKILYMAGKVGGKELANHVSKVAGLSGLKMVDALATGCTEMMGWGIVKVIKCDLQKKQAVFKVEDSPLSMKREEGGAFCHIERGQIAGAMEEVFGVKTDALEVRCRSMGHTSCQFDVKPAGEFDPKDKLVQEQLPASITEKPKKPKSGK